MFATEDEAIAIRYALAEAEQIDMYAGPCHVEIREHGALAVVEDDDDVAMYSPATQWKAEILPAEAAA